LFLIGEADKTRVLDEENSRREFYLQPEKAASIAYEILEESFDKVIKKKPPKKLLSEIVRVLFKVKNALLGKYFIRHQMIIASFSLGWYYGIRRNFRFQF
jgi:hypothetical protein